MGPVMVLILVAAEPEFQEAGLVFMLNSYFIDTFPLTLIENASRRRGLGKRRWICTAFPHLHRLSRHSEFHDSQFAVQF